MGFLDKLLGRGRQAMGQVAAGGSLNPEQAVQQQAEAAKQRAESARRTRRQEPSAMRRTA